MPALELPPTPAATTTHISKTRPSVVAFDAFPPPALPSLATLLSAPEFLVLGMVSRGVQWDTRGLLTTLSIAPAANAGSYAGS